MDATKAWKGVDHDKQPEVVGMLEMYSTKKRLRNVATLLGIGPVRLWYARGWHRMADILVEVQNIVSLSYHSLWDQQAFTIKEETVDTQWCLWKGQAVSKTIAECKLNLHMCILTSSLLCSEETPQQEVSV